MKKIFTAAIIFTMLFVLFSCTNQKTNDTKYEYGYGPGSKIVVTKKTDVFPAEFEGNYSFSSGAGAWSTDIKLNPDGSFTGEYMDTNLGESGNNYDSTIYLCKFTGNFKIVGKIDEYSYYATVSQLSFADKKEEIDDKIRYVYTAPAGLKNGERFVLYTPQTPTDKLDDAFLSWYIPWVMGDEPPSQKLDKYGLYNIDSEFGFFSFEHYQ